MQKTTLKVLSVTLLITIGILTGSYFYYDDINQAEDPRILSARKLQQQYEKQLDEDQPGLALRLLEEMEKVYASVPGYEKSFELGVIENNKASVYLIQVETEILTKENPEKDAIYKRLEIARKHTEKALEIYTQWLSRMGKLSRDEIVVEIEPYYDNNDPAFFETDADQILQKRADDLVLAQIETRRRMSVSLTNLGFINRYSGNLEEAKKNYESAIDLWERNYTAQDNLSMLLNQPVKKRNMIEKLFPPEKDQEPTSENNS